MNQHPPPAKVLSPVARFILFVGALIGYAIGWYFRIQAQMTGALFGALFGAGGVLLGIALVYPIIHFVPGMMEDPPPPESETKAS